MEIIYGLLWRLLIFVLIILGAILAGLFISGFPIMLDRLYDDMEKGDQK